MNAPESRSGPGSGGQAGVRTGVPAQTRAGALSDVHRGLLWQEYLAAARALDAAYPAATTAPAPRPACPDDLKRLRVLLRQQGARLTAGATRAGLPKLRLDPGAAERAVAVAAATADPAAALHRCRQLIARCDAELGSAAPDRQRRRPPRAVLIALAVATVLTSLVLILTSVPG